MLKQQDSSWEIRRWRKHLGWNLKTLSEKSGILISILSEIENGKRRINNDHISAVSEAMGITVAQLLAPPTDEPVTTKSIAQVQPKTLPILGDVAGGMFLEVDGLNQDDPELSTILPTPRYRAEFQYVLRVKGKSINKYADDGDLLHVVSCEQRAAKIGDLVVVQRTKDNGGLIETSAKFYKETKDKLIFEPASTENDKDKKNPRYNTIIVEKDKPSNGIEVEIKAVVVNIMKSMIRD